MKAIPGEHMVSEAFESAVLRCVASEGANCRAVTFAFVCYTSCKMAIFVYKKCCFCFDFVFRPLCQTAIFVYLLASVLPPLRSNMICFLFNSWATPCRIHGLDFSLGTTTWYSACLGVIGVCGAAGGRQPAAAQPPLSRIVLCNTILGMYIDVVKYYFFIFLLLLVEKLRQSQIFRQKKVPYPN